MQSMVAVWGNIGVAGTNLYFLELRQQACTQGAYLSFVMAKQQPHHAVQVSSHFVGECINMLVLYMIEHASGIHVKCKHGAGRRAANCSPLVAPQFPSQISCCHHF